MKKLIYTITALVVCAVSAHAQVGIETADVSEKAILDFPDNADGAILLPYVATPDSNSIAGTLIYDANSGAVQFKDNANEWVTIGNAPKDTNNVVAHDAAHTEKNADGVVISNTGAPTNAIGALVLESTDRALALPKVNGVENLESPKAGMICYDTSRNALAIFNGEKWILRN